MRRFLYAGPLLLTGCTCGFQECAPCLAEGADDITLVFGTDTLGGRGFRRAEVQSAYVVRYPATAFSGPADTIRQGSRRQDGMGPLDYAATGVALRALPPPPLPQTTGSGASVYRFK